VGSPDVNLYFSIKRVCIEAATAHLLFTAERVSFLLRRLKQDAAANLAAGTESEEGERERRQNTVGKANSAFPFPAVKKLATRVQQ
jgi:hypothetical protein